MKNTKTISLFFLWLIAFTGIVSAQSKLGPVYYMNDFTGNSLSDNNTTSITGASGSTVSIENESLAFTLSDFIQYEVFGTVEFALPIDLSENATIMIRSKWENLVTEPDAGSVFLPSMAIYLYDALGNRTGGDNSHWEIQVLPQKDTWTVGSVNLAKYPNSVDMSNIRKIEFRYYNTQVIKSGKILFDYIYLGSVPSELPIQTRTTFRNDYSGMMINDIYQTTDIEKGGGTQSDGKFTIPVYSSYNSWNTYYGTRLTNTIDMSGGKTVKMGIEIINGDNGAGERNVNEEFSPRIIDDQNRRCVLNGSNLNGFSSGDITLNFSSGFLEDGDFDFTKVKEFRLMTGATNPGSGTIILDYLQLGMDISPVQLSFVSANQSGATIRFNPAIPGLTTGDIIISDGAANINLSGITTGDNGSTYTITGSFEASKNYSLDFIKDGWYTDKLHFNLNGSVKVLTPTVRAVDEGLIRILFDEKVDLAAGNFSLKESSSGNQIAITSVSPTYEGLAYDVVCDIQSGISASLTIQKDGYIFGEPLFIRVAKNPALVSVDWNTVVAPVTAMHWGVNDYAASNQTTLDQFHVDYLNKIEPGIIRIHRAGLINTWTNSTTRDWDKNVMRTALTNAQAGHQNSKVLLCIDEWPHWMHSGGALPKEKEDELITLIAKLPAVIKELGFKVDYYEFLNERDNLYQDAGRINDLWDLINRIAIAIKQAHPDIKAGGPALTWPNSSWYEPFLNKCGENIDFISWHNYASGSPETTNAALFSDQLSLLGNSYPAGVINYLKSKGWENRIETFLDEFNVQWTWTPYEERHHNHIGASWMALLIKRLATQKVTGAMVWNSKDGSYGLLPGDFYSAPANLYIWGKNFLRGNMVKSSADEAGRVELFPVITSSNSKSLLIVNKSPEEATVLDVYALMGLSGNAGLSALVLDETTRLGDKRYTTKALETVDNDLLVLPYGMILLTTSDAEAVTAPYDLNVEYILHDAIRLNWKNDDLSRRGFRIKVDGEQVMDVTGTSAVINNLAPGTTYDIKVLTLDEFYNTDEAASVSTNQTTLLTPLIINDRTTGNRQHEVNYSGQWSFRTDAKAYNNDYSFVAKAGASVEIPFEGRRVAIFVYSAETTGKANIYIDNVLIETINTNRLEEPFNIGYYGAQINDGEHVLKIESVDDTSIGIDKIYIYGSRFENVTQSPGKVAEINPIATFSTISLTWEAPQTVSGIQYYQVSLENVKDTIVYSPAVTFEGVEEETAYRIIIRAYDPCGNFSESNPFNVSTPKKIMTNVYQKPGSETITIDGKADEAAWSTTLEIPLENYMNAPGNTESLSASFKTMWDKNYLYILLTVKDDVKTTAVEESSVTDNDGFELFLDGNNKKAGNYTQTDAWFQYQYNPVLLTEFYNSNPWLTVAKTDTENGYMIEMRYRWTGIGMYSVDTGSELGMDIHVNDNDKMTVAGLDNKLTWQTNSVNAGNNTALLGNLVLAGTTSIKTVLSSVLQVYPNPVETELSISVDETEFSIQIMDMTGKIVIAEENTSTVNVSRLSPGIYTIRVNTQQAVYTTKIIKK